MLRKFAFLLFILISSFLFSQEGTKPLSSNLNYIYKNLKPVSTKNEQNASPNKPAASGPITLPFIEDFFYSSQSNYPDPNKWEDSLVYVNSGMANAPPSIGVATFDGLNKHGYPYNPTLSNLTIPNPADTLTSKPINLHTIGGVTLTPNSFVGLSFYYQARGKGENPELNDSLIVDFYRPYAAPDSAFKPDTAWKRVWFSLGSNNSNTNDTTFKRVFIKITDSAYFHEGFRFRFRNWASVTGNFDHWHVDYIFLNHNRKANDTIVDTTSYTKDITFGDMPTHFLKDYSEMPRQQYRPFEMASNISVKIRNNSSEDPFIVYKYRVFDHNNIPLFPEYFGGYKTLNPFWPNSYSPPTNGYDKTPEHANPIVKDTFAITQPISAQFRIKHSVSFQSVNASDTIKANDTLIQYQNFRNFYAFDDGSAEAGYYVNAAGAKMAVKIKLNTLDTLNALRIYFDPAGYVSTISNTNTVYNFTINVWGEGANGGPSDNALILKDSATHHPDYYNTGFKEIPEFKLQKPLILGPGTYFIGIKQASSIITVGFDRNYNHNTNMYYDAGNGWKQSEEHGSIMMHPVFGTYLPLVGLKEIPTSAKNKNFLVYPNPASSQFIIRSNTLNSASYLLFNSIGQLVKEEPILTNEQSVSTEELSSGVYVLILNNKGQAAQQQKIIVQH
jgi:hypothetical protein